MEKKYLTVKEVAGLLGVTPLTLRNWDKKGKLKARRNPINNYRVYKREDIEELVGEIEASPAPKRRTATPSSTPVHEEVKPPSATKRKLQIRSLKDDNY